MAAGLLSWTVDIYAGTAMAHCGCRHSHILAATRDARMTSRVTSHSSDSYVTAVRRHNSRPRITANVTSSVGLDS